MSDETKPKRSLPLFLASNTPPAPVMLYGDHERPLFGHEARYVAESIANWDNVKFAFCIPVGGSVEQFIPIAKEEADLKIEDFKYIIRFD